MHYLGQSRRSACGAVTIQKKGEKERKKEKREEKKKKEKKRKKREDIMKPKL